MENLDWDLEEDDMAIPLTDEAEEEKEKAVTHEGNKPSPIPDYPKLDLMVATPQIKDKPIVIEDTPPRKPKKNCISAQLLAEPSGDVADLLPASLRSIVQAASKLPSIEAPRSRKVCKRPAAEMEGNDKDSMPMMDTKTVDPPKEPAAPAKAKIQKKKDDDKKNACKESAKKCVVFFKK